MQPIVLAVKPGCDTQGTPLMVGQGMIDCNLIRHRNGRIEKLPLSTQLIDTKFTGTATYMEPWAALNGTVYIAIGTTSEVALISGGVLTNITPAGGVGSGYWTMDKFGQDLVAAPMGGHVYQWVPPVSGGNILTVVPNSPAAVNGLIVAAPEQQVITWGAFSSSLGEQDPLLFAWCDIADITDWTATATNQAGTFRIPAGSEIVQVIWYGLSGLFWTDLDFWAMTYAGFPLVYGFNKIAPNAGLIGPRAAEQLGSRVAWMGQNEFFVYQGGQVQPLPCTVRDFVFGNLDRNFPKNIHCDTNTYGNEFMWRFPTIGSAGVTNAYAKWQPDDNVWDKGFGQPEISAWTDQSVAGPPMGADYTGLVQQFETSLDFNGTPLTSSFTTGWFQLAETEEFLFVERILPDFSWTQNAGTPSGGSQVLMTINVADEIPPLDTDFPIRTYGPYTITPATPYIIVRARGRVAQVVVQCSAANTFWRYGKPPAVVSVDGRQG